MEFLRKKLSAVMERPSAAGGSDTDKLRAAAQSAQAQKRYRRALALYGRLAELCPDDPVAQLRHGELLMRAGRRGDALASLEAAATRFTERHEHAKASAVWRMVLELSPSHPGARDYIAARC